VTLQEGPWAGIRICRSPDADDDQTPRSLSSTLIRPSATCSPPGRSACTSAGRTPASPVVPSSTPGANRDESDGDSGGRPRMVPAPAKSAREGLLPAAHGRGERDRANGQPRARRAQPTSSTTSSRPSPRTAAHKCGVVSWSPQEKELHRFSLRVRQCTPRPRQAWSGFFSPTLGRVQEGLHLREPTHAARVRRTPSSRLREPAPFLRHHRWIA